jgi:hypothetical protein
MKKKTVFQNQLCDNCKKLGLCPDYQENLKFLTEGFSINIVECEIFENKNFDISEKGMEKV